ncbi:putative coil containing protein [Vibrio phage 217E38-1]|nr:putative coil containing protein [Vibrio phage 217E38-1]
MLRVLFSYRIGRVMEIDKMIKIGDKVKVTGTGGIYTTYQKMADLMGSKLFKKNLYPETMEFEVIEKHKHHSMDEMVYLLKNDEGEFLFTDKDSAIEVIAKPRTKTEFVKCEFEHAWEAVKAFEDGEELYTKRSHKDFVLIDNAPDVLRFLYGLYSKVETEIDERQEFIDTACAINEKAHGERRQYLVESMYDSGKFKLVEK